MWHQIKGNWLKTMLFQILFLMGSAVNFLAVDSIFSFKFTLLGIFCISWSIDSLSIIAWMINDEQMFSTSKNNLLTKIKPKAEST